MTGIREIGSEFWDVPITDARNDLFDLDTKWYLSGRSALRAVIKSIRGAKSVSMPAWCCESMIIPFVQAGWKINFYPVYPKDGTLVFDMERCEESEVLFLIDYFGFEAPKCFNFSNTVIRDVTHSLLSRRYSDANYYFGSLRKIAGFWTGGYAWGEALGELTDGVSSEYVDMRRDAMNEKRLYIEGVIREKAFLNTFASAEHRLDEITDVLAADSRDVDLACRMNVELIKKQRVANATVLLRELGEYALFDKIDGDCPIFFPILVPNNKRDELRRYLIENEIYCPIHWPRSPYHKIDDFTSRLYEEEISLVCDQRYNESDMQRIAQAVKKFLKRL